MKNPFATVCLGIGLVSATAQGQGVFVFDQQSSTNETPTSLGRTIQQYIPAGQSFTPSLTAINFLRLKLFDVNPTNNFGATLFVNLRTNSISGTILSSTAPVVLPNSFAGTVNFFFLNNVSLVAGAFYFFEIVVQSGDSWGVDAYEYNYLGGTTISQGQPIFGSDLWFREGILMPVLSIQRTNSQPLLSFSTISNQNYAIEVSSDFPSSTWSNLLGTNFVGDGSEVALIDTSVTMSINRFYRLKLVP